MKTWSIQPATDRLEAIYELQIMAYDRFFYEGPDVLEAIVSRAPEFCVTAIDEEGHVGGYLLTYPAAVDHAGELNTICPAGADGDGPPGDAGCWYVHDLAISPSCKGLGLGRMLYEHCRFQALAAGLRSSRLIAVQNASLFWGRFGYRMVLPSPAQRRILNGYGPGAALMELRDLTAMLRKEETKQ